MNELHPDNFYYKHHNEESGYMLKLYAQAICEDLLKQLEAEKIAVYETGKFSTCVISGYDYAISDLNIFMKNLLAHDKG